MNFLSKGLSLFENALKFSCIAMQMHRALHSNETFFATFIKNSKNSNNFQKYSITNFRKIPLYRAVVFGVTNKKGTR